ncbi:MAG: LytR/AlgR family response regulator transcription factor [Terriglobales bacterium]
MPISAIIVDDEKLARDELAYLLQAHPDVELVATGQNGIEAVKLVRLHAPDLLFLDAQMPGLDGLGTVRLMEAKHMRMPQIIFATAHDEYALQAFDANAVDYLLKPFDQGRLAKAMAKVKRNMQGGETVAGKLDRMLELLHAGQMPTAKVLIKAQGRQLLLDARDIVFARVEDGVITVATRQVEGQASYRTIEELQASLGSKDFWRVHRSFLVNLNHVQEVVPWFNSSYQLRMDDRHQTEVPVSRQQSRQLRELYKL